jgi:hypothetical protein
MVEKKNAVLDTGIVAPGFRLIFISLAHERYVVLVIMTVKHCPVKIMHALSYTKGISLI